MALQTFTAGQVLTAAQVTALQTNDFNQTVSVKTDSYTLVAADKGTRVVMNKATATTITVNTSLFNAGDTLWIHNIGAGVCTITAGTATVSTAGSLALAQNAGGTLYFTSAGVAIFFPTAASSANGLTLLNTTSFSGVASQALTDIFSTTYDNYRIVLDVTDFTSDATVYAKLRVSGTDSSVSYYIMCVGVLSTGGSTTSTENNNSNGVFLLRGDSATDNVYGFTGDILNPFKALPTKFNGSTVCTTPTATPEGYNIGGLHFVSTSYTSLNLIATAGNMTGIVSVYGYNK